MSISRGSYGQALRCWTSGASGELQPLGAADRVQVDGGVRPLRAGFALEIANAAANLTVLCSVRSIGPARVEAALWTAEDLQRAHLFYQRINGMLEGGMLILAGFVLVVALLNRNVAYLIFALWLIGNLRLAMLAMGTDTTWLGQAVPPGWVHALRAINMGFVAVLTMAVISAFFAADIDRAGHRKLVIAGQAMALLLLLLAAVLLPYRLFLPVMWVATTLIVLDIIFIVTRVLWVTRSGVAAWFCASVGIVMFSALYEVVAAAFGWKRFIGGMNHVTGTLVSSFMAALAIAEHLRRERADRLRAYRASPVGLFTLDEQGRLLRFNPAFATMLRIDTKRLQRLQWQQVFGNTGQQVLEQALSSGRWQDLSLELGVNGAEPRWFSLQASRIDKSIEGTLQDITERVRASRLEEVNRQLYTQVNIDPLTELPNRRPLHAALQARMDSNAPFVFVLADVDFFKKVNDNYSHLVGDEVLRRVGALLRSALRGSDIALRYGGEEFALILDNADARRALQICDRIRLSIQAAPWHEVAEGLKITMSFGLAQGMDAQSLPDLLHRADTALYEAKASGRNCVRAHDPVTFTLDSPRTVG